MKNWHAGITRLTGFPPLRALLWFNKTFWGRVLVGPAIAIAGAWAEAIRQPLRGDWRHAPMWLGHLAAAARMSPAWADSPTP